MEVVWNIKTPPWYQRTRIPGRQVYARTQRTAPPRCLRAHRCPDEDAFRAAPSAALGELRLDRRAVVHLKLWEALTFEQIAELLGIPPNPAASRYRYGLDKLRERLRPLYDEIK